MSSTARGPSDKQGADRLITAIIADDHLLMSQAMKLVLDTGGKVKVVAIAVTGAEAIEMYRRLRPDVILMDISLPDMEGIRATEQIRKLDRSAKVIVISMFDSPDYVRRALAAGASAYLLKSSSTDEVGQAIEAVLGGGQYFSPSINKWIMGDGLAAARGDAPTGMALLSDRELEVLRAIAEGRSTKEIAAGLHVSPKTIETHRRRIMMKLKIHSVARLIRFAIRNRMVTDND
jgi:two-component system response regulator NreC